jgi:hypothetical protein
VASLGPGRSRCRSMWSSCSSMYGRALARTTAMTARQSAQQSAILRTAASREMKERRCLAPSGQRRLEGGE